MPIEIHVYMYYNSYCKAEVKPLTKGSEEMDEMTTAELNQDLENIAQLVEERTKDKDRETAEIAIQAIRNSKIKA